MSTPNSKENIVLFYEGPINIDLVSFISNYLKQHLKANTTVVGRIYKVVIELIQNISYYSAEQFSSVRSFGSGIGYFKVTDNESYFTITTGNKILTAHSMTLLQNSKEINQLNEDELRDLKRKTRSQASIRDIGAHIGLIQTGLLTGNKLKLEFDPIDDTYSFFTISAMINK